MSDAITRIHSRINEAQSLAPSLALSATVDYVDLMLFMGAALAMIETAEAFGARQGGKVARELAGKLLDGCTIEAAK